MSKQRNGRRQNRYTALFRIKYLTLSLFINCMIESQNITLNGTSQTPLHNVCLFNKKELKHKIPKLIGDRVVSTEHSGKYTSVWILSPIGI